MIDALSVKERFIKAINRQVPDRLPVTTHHIMEHFLNKYMNGASNDEFFEHFGIDPIVWTIPIKYDEKSFENWRVREEELPNNKYKTTRYHISTPKGKLSMVVQANEYTKWVSEHLIKNKSDMEIMGEYMPYPLCDVEEVNRIAERYGDKALIRGHIATFDLFGQPGCWQDAACLMGIEPIIMETYDDPQWVHELLKVFLERKKTFVKSLKGAKYDILELGGGDASSTVISPKLLREFVIPYDTELIQLAHEAGQRIAYHTCGGMMPILEDLASMGMDAMETFSPPGMGGDTDLKEAKRRVGDKVCMIGGFDQFHFFQGCTPEETRKEVRRCFEAAGENGGYIIAPSDHFFDADVELIKAFADEARNCLYK